MAKHPAASIVIVSYNGRKYLANCLASVLAQAGEAGEVVVVDNKSADGSAPFIQEHFPTVRLLQNQENRGFAAACNQGARAAKGRVLVFLNQDTVVLPGWLDGLLQALAAGGNIGLATSQLRLMRDPDTLHLCGQDVHYTGLVFGSGYGRPTASQARVCDVNAVSGASFAIGRKLWEQLGGFDERLYMYYEETDLSWRAQLGGYRCRYVPSSQALHDYSPDRPSETRLYYSFRNRVLLLLKNWQVATLLLLAPALLVAELLELGLAAAQGWRGLRVKAQGYMWIATHLPQVRQMRRVAQAQRRVADVAILASLAPDVRPAFDEAGRASRWAVAIANSVFRWNRNVALGALRAWRPKAYDVEPGGRS